MIDQPGRGWLERQRATGLGHVPVEQAWIGPLCPQQTPNIAHVRRAGDVLGPKPPIGLLRML